MGSPSHVTFTPEVLVRFTSRYNLAVLRGEKTFTFENQQYIPKFAKYLIEYLEEQFGEDNGH